MLNAATKLSTVLPRFPPRPYQKLSLTTFPEAGVESAAASGDVELAVAAEGFAVALAAGLVVAAEGDGVELEHAAISIAPAAATAPMPVIRARG